MNRITQPCPTVDRVPSRLDMLVTAALCLLGIGLVLASVYPGPI